MKLLSKKWNCVLLVGGCLSQGVYASYEKTSFLSAKQLALAGAVNSSISGAESLFYNPAGLAASQDKDFNLVVNAGAALFSYKAPITSKKEEQSDKVLAIPSIFANYKVTPKLGVGLGFYPAGGAGADYGNVYLGRVNGVLNPFSTSLQPQVKGDLKVLEYALGVGYEVADSFRVGGSFRIVHTTAELRDFGYSELATGVSGVLATNMHDLKGTSTSFRFGGQYAPQDKPFGVGVEVRLPVDMKLEGKLSSQLQTNVSALESLEDVNMTLKDKLPLEVAVGGHFDVTQTYRMYLQYDFRHTKANKSAQIIAAHKVPASLGGAGMIPIPNMAKNWNDSHIVRLGNEFKMSPELDLRLGLCYESRIVSKADASPFFSAPGNGYSVATGGGLKISDTIKVNGTIEYAIVARDINAGQLNKVTLPTRDGSYKTQAYSLVLGTEILF